MHSLDEDDQGTASKSLPARIEPLMLAHLAVTRDLAQHRRWQEQVEAIGQAQAIAATNDPDEKSVLAQTRAYRQMKETGVIGALYGFGISTLWMGWLIPLYAVGHGFGWLASMSFLLPIPIAWRVGRRLWEGASLRGMRDRLKKRRFVPARSLRRSFGAGFGLGFTLVFLQALITWFMTPAPTFGLELLIDAFHATIGGIVSGGLGTLLAPLLRRGVPEASALTRIDEP